MADSRWSGLTALYGLIGLVGVFLLYWGAMSLVDPSHVPSVTFPWLDQTLTRVGQHLWIPAVGVLFLIVGISPVMIPDARRSRVAQLILCGVGFLFFCVSGALIFISLSPLTLFYLSPLILTGAIFVEIALGFFEIESMRMFPA